MTRYTGEALAQTQSPVVHPVVLVSAFGRHWTMHDAPVTVDGVTYEPQAMQILGLTEATGTDVHNLSIQLPATDEFLQLSHEYNQVQNALLRGGNGEGWNFKHASIVPATNAPTGYILELSPTASEQSFAQYIGEAKLRCQPGDRVVVAAYARGSADSASFGCSFYKDGVLVLTTYPVSIDVADGEWHYYVGSIVVPAGANEAVFIAEISPGRSDWEIAVPRLSQSYTWSPISMRIAYLDADGKPVTGIPSQGYLGGVVSVNPAYDADNNVIEIVAQDFTAYMRRPGGLRFNSEDHQTRPGAATDTFFDNLPKLKGRKVQWLGAVVNSPTRDTGPPHTPGDPNYPTRMQ